MLPVLKHHNKKELRARTAQRHSADGDFPTNSCAQPHRVPTLPMMFHHSGTL